jgi:hypothetical protein
MSARTHARRGLAVAGLAAIALLASTATASAAAPVRERPDDRGPIARASFCIVCVPVGLAALRAAAAAARAARAAKAARQMIAASRAFTKAQRVRRKAIRAAVAGARRVAPHGPRWIKRNWGRLKLDVRRCLGGGAALLTADIVDGDTITEVEWQSFIAFHMPTVSPLELWSSPQFDFSDAKDPIIAACLAGMVSARVGGS